jgi:hypothetical protein
MKNRRQAKNKYNCNNRRSGKERREMPCRCDKCYVRFVKELREKK